MKTTKRYFRCLGGNTASISKTSTGEFRLRACLPNGKLYANKVYATERGARSALSRWSDATWEEVQRGQAQPV